jgi:alanine racemase
MIRLGIGLYGVSAVHQQNIQNVSSLKTFIAQLREVPAIDTVGYNRSGKLTRLSKIATLPIGYADGLNRRLSNGLGKVMINGVLVPIVGNISMDTCMVDVTDLSKVEEGYEVIVFGENPTIINLAKAMDTIPYEVLTSISRRVKRVYIQE